MELASSAYYNPVDTDKAFSVFKRVRMMPMYSFPCLKEFNLALKEHENRFFLHMDLDAFYAQVEQRDNPNYRGKPVGVVSLPDTNTKGIVMTSSYEARALGIDIAMSTYFAKLYCPELILVPCYGQKYESILFHILSMAKKFVPDEAIEQYSIDECFIDLSHYKNFKEAEKVAREIKKQIWKKENLTCSMGLSFNKTYAKMATKLNKPDGFSVVRQQDRGKIFYSKPIDVIWGIGRRIQRRMNSYGIFTIRQLAEANLQTLKKEFGINGIVYYKMARGEETVEIFRKERAEKSFMHQHSLTYPIYKKFECEEEIARRVEYIGRKLRAKNLIAKRLLLVLRFTNLEYDVAEYRLPQYTNNDRKLYESALHLYKDMQQPNKDLQMQMFGIMVTELEVDVKEENLDLFVKELPMPYHSLDRIKNKYGENIIRIGVGKF